MHALVMSVSDVSVSATFMSSWSSTHGQRNRGKAYLGLWFWRAEVHPHREGIGRALCVATGSWREWSHLVDQEVNREEQGPGRYTCCLLWKARFQLLKSPQPSEQQAPPAGESKIKKHKLMERYSDPNRALYTNTIKMFLKFISCVWVLHLHVCMNTVCVAGACRGQKKYQISWKWIILSHDVGAGNRTRVLCKSSRHSQPLSHHCSFLY